MCAHCGELSDADLATVGQEMRFSERGKNGMQNEALTAAAAARSNMPFISFLSSFS